MKLSPSAIKALNNFPILVFEEIDPDNLKYVKLGSLSLEGLAHPQRISYMKKWHVIYPAVVQVYATKDAHVVSIYGRPCFST